MRRTFVAFLLVSLMAGQMLAMATGSLVDLRAIQPSSAAAAAARVLVSMGQSNNQGEGCCYNASVDDGYANMLQYVIDDAYSDSRYLPDIHQHSHQLTHATEPMFDGGNNRAHIIGSLVALGRHFGSAGNTVLVQTAVSGTSMAQWLSGGLLARAVLAAANASALAGHSPITLFTWVQGESDSGRTTSAYLADLLTVISIARNSTPGASPTTPFIVGSMVPEWTAESPAVWPIMEAHRLLPNLVPHTAYQQMPQGYVDCVEGIHFGATGQRLMAALMAEAVPRALANTRAGLIPAHPTNLSISSNSSSVVLSWVAAPPSNSTPPAQGYVVRWKLYDRPANPGTYPNCSDHDASLPHSLPSYSDRTDVTIDASNFRGGGTWQFAVFAFSGGQLSSGRYDSYALHKISAQQQQQPQRSHVRDADEAAGSDREGERRASDEVAPMGWLLCVTAVAIVLASLVLCAVRLHRGWSKQPVLAASLLASSTSVKGASGRLYHAMVDQEEALHRAA